MASTRALLLILCTVSQRSRASTCGAGPGDRRQIEVAQQECAQCNGTEAELVFDDTVNDGVGWTACYVAASTSRPLENFELAMGFSCGGALGDFRKSSIAQRLCQDCGGEVVCQDCGGDGAELIYESYYADGIGQTFCKKGNLELSQPLSQKASAVRGDQTQPTAESETVKKTRVSGFLAVVGANSAYSFDAMKKAGIGVASIDALLDAVSTKPIVSLAGASLVVTLLFSLVKGIAAL